MIEVRLVVSLDDTLLGLLRQLGVNTDRVGSVSRTTVCASQPPAEPDEADAPAEPEQPAAGEKPKRQRRKKGEGAEAAPAEADAAAPAVTIEQLQKLSLEFLEKVPDAVSKLKALTAEFGVAGLANLKPDQYDAAAARLKAIAKASVAAPKPKQTEQSLFGAED